MTPTNSILSRKENIMYSKLPDDYIEPLDYANQDEVLYLSKWVMDILTNAPSTPRCHILTGNKGTGKTKLASGFGRFLCNPSSDLKPKSVRYFDIVTALRHLKDDDTFGKVTVRNPMLTSKVVIIDRFFDAGLSEIQQRWISGYVGEVISKPHLSAQYLLIVTRKHPLMLSSQFHDLLMDFPVSTITGNDVK